MSQLKRALEKKMYKQFKAADLNDEEMQARLATIVTKLKEKRRLAKEKARLYR